jgi:hypothetical protein
LPTAILAQGNIIIDGSMSVQSGGFAGGIGGYFYQGSSQNDSPQGLPGAGPENTGGGAVLFETPDNISIGTTGTLTANGQPAPCPNCLITS